MAVLGIDTAGPVVGAAIWSPVRTSMWSMRITRRANSVLLPAVADLIDGVSLDLVAVSVGPGPFTGLRVGVSAALGIALSRSVPVVAISSLMARAALVRQPQTLALLDARKGRVYSGLYDARPDVPVLMGKEQDIALSEALPDAPFCVVGEGAVVFAADIAAAGGQSIPDAQRSPAIEVARLGWLLRDTAMDAGGVALRYLRPPDARPPSSVGQQIGRRGR